MEKEQKTIPEGSRILYRKLTKKSQLKFGRYYDLCVGDVMALGSTGIDYLVWVYFHCSNISYVDPLLDELEIKNRIEKPSSLSPVDAQVEFYRWKDNYWKEKLSEEDYRGYVMHDRKRRKLYLNKKISKSLKVENQTPGALAWKNQGH